MSQRLDIVWIKANGETLKIQQLNNSDLWQLPPGVVWLGWAFKMSTGLLENYCVCNSTNIQLQQP